MKVTLENYRQCIAHLKNDLNNICNAEQRDIILTNFINTFIFMIFHINLSEENKEKALTKLSELAKRYHLEEDLVLECQTLLNLQEKNFAQALINFKKIFMNFEGNDLTTKIRLFNNRIVTFYGLMNGSDIENQDYKHSCIEGLRGLLKMDISEEQKEIVTFNLNSLMEIEGDE